MLAPVSRDQWEETSVMEFLQEACIVQIDEIEQAFHQASGTWVGCDWPTEFGNSRLDLNGLKATQALLLARATSGRERADWQAAVTWLTQVEHDARVAEELAGNALELARTGELIGAVYHAESACHIEAKYHHQLVWQPLRDALFRTHKLRGATRLNCL